METPVSVTIRFRGSGIKLVQIAIPSKLSDWKMTCGKNWNQLLFDLETYEHIGLPGVHSWNELVRVQEWSGLDPFLPGSIELRFPVGELIKIKPSSFCSPELFPEKTIETIPKPLFNRPGRLWIVERTIGSQGSWKSTISSDEIRQNKFIQLNQFQLANLQFMLIRIHRLPGRLFKKQKQSADNLVRDYRVLDNADFLIIP
jgi:hypothetical protein